MKRVRLRGDWSDTGRFSWKPFLNKISISSGPDSRPSNEEESEPTTNQSEPSPTVPGRNVQNFFMQRMSDILTQLVTSATSETGEAETTTAVNESPITTETNTASSPIRNSPIVPTPSTQNSAAAATNTNDNESDVSFR